MKKYLLCSTMLAMGLIAAFAQNLAVKFYGQVSNPQNIPTNWPAVVSEIGTNNAGPGYTQFTKESLKQYIAQHQPEMDAWEAAQKSAEENFKKNNLQALKQIMDDLQTAEDNWGTLTTIQQLAILRKHNQLLLRLRPFLYLSYQERVLQ